MAGDLDDDVVAGEILDDVAPQPPAPLAGKDDDDLDELLREYDEPKPSGTEKAVASAELDDFDRLMAELDRIGESPTSDELKAHAQTVDQMRETLIGIRETADATRLFELASAFVSELPQAAALPDDYIARWMLAEHARDPYLQQAWAHRYDSADAMAAAEKEISRVMKRLYQEVSRMPDIKATSDRAAVAHYVRTAGAGDGPAAVDWDAVPKMSDHELETLRRQLASGQA